MSTPYPKRTRAAAHAEVPSMQPQEWCSLPWCGRAPGGPTKAYNVRTEVSIERLEYPEGIDAHHPWGRPGPVMFVCHECHDGHHMGHGRRIIPAYEDGRWQVYDDGVLVPCVTEGCAAL